MTLLSNDKLEAIVERLEGQCLIDLEQAMEEEGVIHLLDDTDTLQQIDERIFQCEQCGWWCSTDELHDDSNEKTCEDCSDAED